MRESEGIGLQRPQFQFRDGHFKVIFFAKGGWVYTFSAPTDEAFRPHKITVDDLKATAMPAITGMPYTDGSKAKASMGVTLANNWIANWLDSEKMGTYSWAIGELIKGTEILPDWPFTLFTDSQYGGWGFNTDKSDGYCQSIIPGICNTIPPAQANLLDRDPTDTDPGRDILMTKPFFDKGKGNGYLYTNDTVNSSADALSTAKLEKLLANEIPALTFAVGHRGVDKTNIINIDIRDEYLVQDGAPWPRGTADRYEWRHSDFINVAYPYLYKLFDKFKNIGQPVPGGGI